MTSDSPGNHEGLATPLLLRSNLAIPLVNKLQVKVIYYSEGWNIYWEQITVSLSAQCMCISSTCNTKFRLFVILGDESIHLVRLCLQVKPFVL